MGYLLENDFSSYKLTLEEEQEGSLLTIGQKQVIQNDISALAHGKLDLKYDPAKPEEFLQQESYIKGQIDALRFRLHCCSCLEEEREIAANPAIHTLDSNN